MREVILVRHAPTSWSGRWYAGHGDPPLNGAGRVVASSLAGELAGDLAGGALAGGVRIVSSPARRARQTAGVIARRIPGSRIEVDPRWSEVDFGIADGLTFDELATLAPDLAGRLAGGEVDIDWPDGEAAESLAARVRSAWRDLLEEPSTVVVVSHAGPLRIAIAMATGRPVQGVDVPEPGASVRVVVGPTRRADQGPMLRFRP